jgi:hypothetical protein
MKTLRFLNVVAVVSTFLINTLSQAVPFNNQTNAEIANLFPNNYFLPANYVFGIWGVIYLSLFAFAIFQARRDNRIVREFGLWVILSCIGNIGWIFAFQWNLFALSMIPIVLLLVSLLVMYVRILPFKATLTRGEWWCIALPISIYAGWVTVATIANVTYVLLDAGWDGFGISYETWGALIIVVGGVIGGVFAFIHRDAVYAGVIVWAFAGIVARHPNVTAVALSAGALAALLALVGVFSLLAARAANAGSTMRRGTA